jgi:hypothetical protein
VNEIKDDGMRRKKCSTHEGEDKGCKILVEETNGKRPLGISRRIILKWFLNK